MYIFLFCAKMGCMPSYDAILNNLIFIKILTKLNKNNFDPGQISHLQSILITR